MSGDVGTMKAFSIAVASAMLLLIAYVFITYLRTASLYYNPPWDDPLFCLAALVSVAGIALAVIPAIPISPKWKTSLIVGALLLMAECGSAAWFDRRFQAECDSLPPGSFAPGCPDAPYKP
jgi:hypothetical protein